MLFDITTQRTIAKIKKITIGPIVEMFYSDIKKDEVISILKTKAIKATREERDLIYKDIHKIDLRDNVETLHQYIDLFNESKSIFDFVNDKKIYVINEDKINAIMVNNYKETISHLDNVGIVETKDYVSFIFDLDFLKKYSVPAQFCRTTKICPSPAKLLQVHLSLFHSEITILSPPPMMQVTLPLYFRR